MIEAGKAMGAGAWDFQRGFAAWKTATGLSEPSREDSRPSGFSAVLGQTNVTGDVNSAPQENSRSDDQATFAGDRFPGSGDVDPRLCSRNEQTGSDRESQRRPRSLALQFFGIGPRRRQQRLEVEDPSLKSRDFGKRIPNCARTFNRGDDT
jgi:hypothetical protein